MQKNKSVQNWVAYNKSLFFLPKGFQVSQNSFVSGYRWAVLGSNLRARVIHPPALCVSTFFLFQLLSWYIFLTANLVSTRKQYNQNTHVLTSVLNTSVYPYQLKQFTWPSLKSEGEKTYILTYTVSLNVTYRNILKLYKTKFYLLLTSFYPSLLKL